MSDTWNGNKTGANANRPNWFNTNNWSTGNVPVPTANGDQSVTIGTTANQAPVIAESSASSHISITQSGSPYSEYQLDGESITMTSGAALTLQGVALGSYGTDAFGNSITTLTAAPSSTATFDTYMEIETGTGTLSGTETLNINGVNYNFGDIDAASGTLNVTGVTGGTGNALYNYGLISVATGAELQIGTIATTGDTIGLYNDGWIEVSGGTLNATAGILDGATTPNTTGPDGYIEISNGGDVILGGTVSAKEEVLFNDTTTANTLQIIGTAFSGTIAGFGGSDVINLGTSVLPTLTTGESIALSYSTATDVLTISEMNGSTVEHSTSLTITGTTALTAANFTFASTSTGIQILTDMPCYASGTRILTETGEQLVEDLAVGDTVITVREGGPAMRKIVWTGRRSVDITRHPQPELALPVRIRAGAFGPGVPERDLRLSPHHAVYTDGCLFEAQSLVNGVTIIQEQNTRHVTYHHIELDEHDVMLAEGLPAESFLDTGNRNMFEHASAPMALHADFRPQSDEGFCAPMVREGAALDAVRTRLQQRADALLPTDIAA